MKNIIKKISIFGFISLLIATFSLIPVATHADNGTFFQGRTNNSCTELLGLTSWDCNVNISDQDSLKESIWIIVSNIAVDISVIAAYLIIGYVIYGGYLYMFSNGDPGKTAAGRKTLAHGFIGLAIVMSATIIMGALRVALVGNSGNIGNCVSAGGCVDANTMVSNLIGWVTAITGIVSAIFLVYGGILYISSTGDPGKVKRAKDTILYSLIGLAVVALSVVITAFVSNLIREANNTSYHKTIISKEVYDYQIH